MRSPEDRKWSKYDEPSPREKREMFDRGEWRREPPPRKKAPLPLRFLAWLSLIAIFFAVGYGATSLVFKWMDRGGTSRHPDNLVVSGQDAQRLVEETVSQDAVSSTVSCVISVPMDTEFETKQKAAFDQSSCAFSLFSWNAPQRSFCGFFHKQQTTGKGLHQGFRRDAIHRVRMMVRIFCQRKCGCGVPLQKPPKRRHRNHRGVRSVFCK